MAYPSHHQMPYAPPTPPPPQPRRRRTGRIVTITIGSVVLALVALILAKHFTSSPQYTDEEIYAGSTQKVFNDLGKALKAKDEAAFVAPFTGEAKEQQRQLFRNLVKVPFTVARWEPLHQGVYGKSDIHVGFVHQIKGIDVAPVYEQYTFTFANLGADGPKKVSKITASEKPEAGLPGTNYPAPWDVYEDMTVARKGRVLVVGDKRHGQDINRFAPHVAQGADDIVTAWDANRPTGAKVAENALVILEPDRKIFSAFYSGRTDGGDPNSFEAGYSQPLAAFKADYEDKIQSGGSRIVMDSSLSRFKGPDWKSGVEEITRHEFAHSLVSPLNTARGALRIEPSMWIVEGFADYMEGRGNQGRNRAEEKAVLDGYSFGGILPPNDEELFYSTKTRDRSANYVLSRLVMEYLVKKHGERATFDFVVDSYVDPGNDRQLIEELTGQDRQAFSAGWERYVRDRVPGIGTW
ncbi:hypothetical protein ABZW18_00645 [Streptomyces sp. NPDC004647]|uniref:hypothetical protein n=1 Tax=Streptomyces sp. NPDC004647 TaxID=3154671 RepID=UPI0033B45CDC